MSDYRGREGQQVGNYRLLRLLGRGGFAEVYLGEHIYLRRYAALKLLLTSLSDEQVDQFLAEAQTLARLDHPHIVRVQEFFVEKGIPVLVMDYASHGTLRQRHPSGSYLSLETTVSYVKQIAAALQYAHNHQVIHRDVKPENMLLGPNQEVLLSDFGLALLTPSPDLLTTQEMSGTLPYMAPEQIRGKPDFASDQYSLGIVVYEWLCGTRPFTGPLWQVAYEQAFLAPAHLRAHDPSLPQDVEDVVLKALTKDPKERYASVQLFVRALERASQETSTNGRSDTEVTTPLNPPAAATLSSPPVDKSRGYKRVFISASPADRNIAARLTTDLQRRGVTVWKEPQAGRDGPVEEGAFVVPYQSLGATAPAETDALNQVRQAIRAVDIVLVVVSPHARASDAVAQQLRIASLYQRQLLFVWTTGDDITAVLPQVWGKTVQVDLIDAREKPYEQVQAELMSLLEELADASDVQAELPKPNFEPRNPYKGLRPFTERDAADFFGRDGLVDELLEMLKRAGQLSTSQESMPQRGDGYQQEVSDISTQLQPFQRLSDADMVKGAGQGLLSPPATRVSSLHKTVNARLLAVIGPSGSGKSSVVLAGLLPHLQRGALPGSRHWVYLEPLVSGAHPLEALALVLAPHFPNRSLYTLRQDLADPSARGLHLLATQLTRTAEQQVVLVVDQFEELFTLTTSEQERQHCIDLLVTAASEPRGPLLLLLTLRADFYDRLASYPVLGRLIARQQVAVLPMEVSELRAAIKRPAGLPDVQLTFEGNLVGDLLFEVQGQPGALPLLQFTLEQLFERRSGHRFTLQAYQQIGGVKGALARHAEATYRGLPSEEHRRLARALFLRLLDPGLSEQDTTRRRAALTELVLPTAQENEILQQVIAYFLAARLLTTSERGGTPTLEVSHEALIREWKRLAEWLHEAREDVQLQQTVSEDAASWQQRGKPRDRLYRGSQLKEAQNWARRNVVSQDEAAFLQASTVRSRFSRIVALSLVLLLLLLLVPLGLLARSVLEPNLVTNPNDDGPGSLRYVISTAAPGAYITFDPSLNGGTITLTSNVLIIDSNLHIIGPGPGLLTIVGGGSAQKVEVKHGASVSISGLTFTHFSDSAIKNYGRLTLRNSLITGNTTQFVGGGIYNNYNATLTLEDSIVSNNRTAIATTSFANDQSHGYGGGIANEGSLAVINSTIAGNRAERDGGGIFSGNSSAESTLHSMPTIATLTLINSTVSGNSATRNGGGIYNGTTVFAVPAIPTSKTVSTVTATNSTISDNSASGNGGGIYNSPATRTAGTTTAIFTVLNSTIGDNKAAINGGGFYNVSGGLIDITFCTIYGNSAIREGGGFFIEAAANIAPGRVKMRNSLVAADHAAAGPDVFGTLTTGGYNLVQDFSAITFNGPFNLHATDIAGNTFPSLRLDSLLRDNGGQSKPHTFTRALFAGSPAINKIPLSACLVNGITTDQRGVRRPQGPACDIGAYEYKP